jgi:hypothetical protein
MSTNIEYQLHLGDDQNARPGTGSSNNFARNLGRNALLNANTMFSRVADTMDRQPTPFISCLSEIQYGRLDCFNALQLESVVIQCQSTFDCVCDP